MATIIDDETVTKAEQSAGKVPGLMFSHFGIYCADLARLEDFYTRVLGFAVSDSGVTRAGVAMSFMTRRPREHHQFVLGEKRAPGTPTTINQVGFKAPSLDELRRIRDRLAGEDGVHDVIAIDHGISWTLYFRDAEGNRISVSVETDWYVPQPVAWPLDLDRSDDEIRRATEAACRATPGFMMREDWYDAKYGEFSAGGQLTAEAPPTGDPSLVANDPPEGRAALLRTAPGLADAPRIAMSHVGFHVVDLPLLVDFYTRVLGYAISGRGIMPAIGAEPAAEYVYLTRDPAEHQQVLLCAGRSPEVPSSIDQLSLRLTSLTELRKIEAQLTEEPDVSDLVYTNHGNSYSIYFKDPEGNRVELAVESVWYVPAPSGWHLDLSLDDEALVRDTFERCRRISGFMIRDSWKQRARDEMVATGTLEAEGLVRHVA